MRTVPRVAGDKPPLIIHCRIDNDGPLLLGTDYWETDHAARGLAYLSINAGALRLLVPRAIESAIAEMETGREVIASRGPWAELNGREGIELLFDDDSQSPFALHIAAEQCDRRWGTDEHERIERRCLVYTRGLRGAPLARVERPAWLRVVPRIPWLKPYVRVR